MQAWANTNRQSVDSVNSRIVGVRQTILADAKPVAETAKPVKKLSPVADGLIVDPAFERRIAEGENNSRKDVLVDVGEYTESLLVAMGLFACSKVRN